MKKSAINYAWALLGVLAVAALLMSLGQHGDVTTPTIDSYAPSGLNAFADLLRVNGYQVGRTASYRLNARSGDIVIAPIDQDKPHSFRDGSKGIDKNLVDFVKGGGRLVVMPFAPNFSDFSKTTLPVRSPATGAKAQLLTRYDADESLRVLFPETIVAAPLWVEANRETNEFAFLAKYGKGLVVGIGDGHVATNRYIDNSDNAAFLLSAIGTIAPKGSRLVFAENAFDATPPGLIEILGPGASGVFYQCAFFFIVIVFTLGKRFGLAEEQRVAQTGQRELVDAVADAYRRAHSTRVACRAAYDRADREVRKALKLSSDAPASERDARLPEALSSEFRRVFEATIDNLTSQDAFERCRALNNKTKAFLKR